MNAAIQVKLLTGAVFGGSDPSRVIQATKPQAQEVAELLAAHIESARQTLSIAIYDFRLAEPEADIVIRALNARAQAGVLVRIAYFQQPARRPHSQFETRGGDPAPGTDTSFYARLHRRVRTKAVTEADIQSIAASVHKKPILGGGHLMHSKYAICDATSPSAAVWTGSANFTTDAWTIQDNNIVIVKSQELASFYATDFAELWDAGRVAGTGLHDLGSATVDGTRIDVAFAPAEGATIDSTIAGYISAARERIVIASMVISSGAILGALVDALERGVALSGVYDGPEMHDVQSEWTRSAAGAGKAAQWQTVQRKLVAKRSEPYTDQGPHNFMHDKCVAVDGGIVVTGSFNFSQNATRNAENILTLHSEDVATQYERYIESLISRYR